VWGVVSHQFFLGLNRDPARTAENRVGSPATGTKTRAGLLLGSRKRLKSGRVLEATIGTKGSEGICQKIGPGDVVGVGIRKVIGQAVATAMGVPKRSASERGDRKVGTN